MLRFSCVLLCALLLFSTLEPIIGRKSFGGGRHSYPKSGGLSGGGHRYPSSGGLSGGGHGYPSSGGSHGYPSSGGLSGGSQGYPSSGGMSGGSHGYPSSGGMSGNHGYPSSGGMSGSHGYPSSGGTSGGSHGYPSPGGGSAYPSHNHPSNNHGYPAGKGLSGNTGSGHSTTNVHYHYHYNPPQQIRYAPVGGAAPISYPVYRGSPPTYVYQYKDSGSKYGTLLAGLALLNLGTLAGSAYAHSHSHSNYKPQPGEICKFGIRKENGDYEETKIDCQLITSFIFEEQAKASGGNNTSVVTTTVTNVTMVNTTNGMPALPAPGALTPVNPTPNFTMLPNGTLIPVNVTSTNVTANMTANGSPANNTMTSSMTVTTTTTNTTTVVNAIDVKGKPIEVTPGLKCYVIRNSPTSNMRKSVPCGLLQTYADKSLRRNSATRNAPAFTILAVVLTSLLFY